MDAREIPKGYYIHKNFEEIATEDWNYYGTHYLTPAKYLIPGSYVMVKPLSYFRGREPIYGFADRMTGACGKILKIKKVIKSRGNHSDDLYDIYFEPPTKNFYKKDGWYANCIECYSWNNEMVIPLIKVSRNIKI